MNENASMQATIDQRVIGQKIRTLTVNGRNVLITMDNDIQCIFENVGEFLVKTGRWRFEPNAPKVKK